MDPDFLNYILKLSVASLCGAVLGWERESKDKPAGIRTIMMVSLGAATATIAALKLYHQFEDAQGKGGGDPTRIISGVIGGLGFLGAGAIMQSRENVSGMTTAATIWVVGSIGVACGLGYYDLAALATGIAFIVLLLIGSAKNHLMTEEESPEKESGFES